MAMATRVAGEEEDKVGKGDGDGNEQMTTRRRQYDDRRRQDVMTTRQRRDDVMTTTQQRDDVMITRQRRDDAGAQKKQWVGCGWIQSKIQGNCGPIIQQAVQKK